MKTKFAFIALLFLASTFSFSQINRDYKKQVAVKYSSKSKLPVLALKSTNRFNKQMLKASLKPKTFTPSSLLFEKEPEKVSYSGTTYTLTPLKMKDKQGAFLLFNGLFDGLMGVVKILPFDSYDERANASQQLSLFMPVRKDKMYQVQLKFEVDFNDNSCRNTKIYISNGNYAVNEPIKKGLNTITVLTKSEFTGNTILNLLNYTLVSCNGETFNTNKHGKKLGFQFKSVEVKELKE